MRATCLHDTVSITRLNFPTEDLNSTDFKKEFLHGKGETFPKFDAARNANMTIPYTQIQHALEFDDEGLPDVEPSPGPMTEASDGDVADQYRQCEPKSQGIV
jgi:hypothetical protein